MLLVRMQTGAAIVENSMEFPHEIKNGTAKGMGVLRVQKGSLLSTALPAFVVCCFVYDGHSQRCEVVSHCGFNLHLSDG